MLNGSPKGIEQSYFKPLPMLHIVFKANIVLLVWVSS